MRKKSTVNYNFCISCPCPSDLINSAMQHYFRNQYKGNNVSLLFFSALVTWYLWSTCFDWSVWPNMIKNKSLGWILQFHCLLFYARLFTLKGAEDTANQWKHSTDPRRTKLLFCYHKLSANQICLSKQHATFENRLNVTKDYICWTDPYLVFDSFVLVCLAHDYKVARLYTIALLPHSLFHPEESPVSVCSRSVWMKCRSHQSGAPPFSIFSTSLNFVRHPVSSFGYFQQVFVGVYYHPKVEGDSSLLFAHLNC